MDLSDGEAEPEPGSGSPETLAGTNHKGKRTSALVLYGVAIELRAGRESLGRPRAGGIVATHGSLEAHARGDFQR